MGRKKKKSLKPWCWYCNREFDDEKVLIGHQKAKHFKCHICHKKLYTAPGLAIHCSQVHKETITKVPNALLERSILDFEIYGMEGIPEEAKRMREIEKYGSASTDDGPDTKRFKVDGAPGRLPGGPEILPGPPGMVAGMAPVIVAGMPPIMPGMIPAPPRGMMPGPATSILPLPPANATPQQPLFPSAIMQQPPPPVASSSSSTDQRSTGAEPTPSTDSGVPLPLKNAPLVVPLPENSLLMHPKEDLSMEEIRALRKKYSTATPSSSNTSSNPGPSSFHPPVPPLTIGSIPTIRPGMGPPPNFGGIRPHGPT